MYKVAAVVYSTADAHTLDKSLPGHTMQQDAIQTLRAGGSILNVHPPPSKTNDGWCQFLFRFSPSRPPVLHTPHIL